MKKKLYGVGINDADYNVRGNNRVIDLAYSRWSCMLFRCYSDSYHKKQGTYENCCVCEEWLLFSNFKKWFDENYIEGYQLDKDIIGGKGNKMYSPQTCCFVPKEVNCLIEKADKSRGMYPVGVGRLKNGGRRFYAGLRTKERKIHLGYFDTAEQAFVSYKVAKESYIKEIATKYYNDGKIARNVYEALMNYKVEITD